MNSILSVYYSILAMGGGEAVYNYMKASILIVYCPLRKAFPSLYNTIIIPLR